MPALLYMGRRWGIGSDELAVPSLCSMALRVVWSVALVVTLVSGRNGFSSVFALISHDSEHIAAGRECHIVSCQPRYWG